MFVELTIVLYLPVVPAAVKAGKSILCISHCASKWLVSSL
ncbi:unnamed protein product [Prunus brigantina]